MKLLSHIRAKSRTKTPPPAEAQIYGHHLQPSLPSHYYPPRSHRASYSSTVAARLPTPILDRIFAYVCPHVRDTSYEPLEESTYSSNDSVNTDGSEDGCMLCDMRDLAHCALVCRGWTVTARELLYRSVRIDPVHYCSLEIVLSERRKHKGFFDRNAEPRDAPKTRLQLFSRSVRAKPESLGILVEYLKMPYMTRETCKADLARTVSVLPHLRYVDLPEGFFSDDPATSTLRQELRARCSEMRKMKYTSGGEGSFALLAGIGGEGGHIGPGHWSGMEVLELSGINVEAATFLRVLGSLHCLRDLRLSDLPWFDDGIFTPEPRQSPQQQQFSRMGGPSSGHMSVMPPSGPTPSFPALTRLSLTNLPLLSADGLAAYLTHNPPARTSLTHLHLQSTAVHPQHLHHFLPLALRLTDLSLTETITRSFPQTAIPPLASPSLRTLHYEITAPTTSHSLTPAVYGATPVSLTQGYYTYLSSSLHAAALPRLRRLYVRDASFPENLIFVPPAAPFAGGGAPQTAGFNQQLEVYSKGLDELEWNFTHVSPPDGPGKRGSFLPLRPVSSYGMGGTGGGGGFGGFGAGGERKSVMVGNGFGGFLAVPQDEVGRKSLDSGSGAGGGGWPSPSLAGKRGTRGDLWR